MKLKKINRKRKGERVLELIGEVPHVGIGPGESRESKGSDPYVLERLRTRMRYTGVSSVCFSKVFLHFSLTLYVASFPSCVVFSTLSFFSTPDFLSFFFRFSFVMIYWTSTFTFRIRPTDGKKARPSRWPHWSNLKF